MIYLCSPYSHDNPNVVKERYEKTVRYVNKLMLNGVAVISPVVYGHNIVEICGSPSDWNSWKDFCESLMVKCDEVSILPLDGWEESEGIKGERELAKKYNKVVTIDDMEMI